jgi:galactokinase
MGLARRITAPGRVNLIGDHTDYNLGLALPVAIDLGTTVEFTPTDSSRVNLYSTLYPVGINLPVDLPLDPVVLGQLEPPWSRLVAAMIGLVHPETGGIGRIETTLPIGAGLSSSAAFMVALAGALGASGTPRGIARLVQQAETFSGVPVGIMDPLVCAGGRAGHGLLIDFATLDTEDVPIPADVELVVADSGVRRSLRATPYASRVAECEAAAVITGPLGQADEADVAGIRDPDLRRRARHVVSECDRVRRVAAALADDDLPTVGALLVESHRSLATDFEVSTPELDALVARLCSIDGVYGARLTGAGFGGCVVALTRPGAVDLDGLGTRAWRLVPSDGTCAREEATVSGAPDGNPEAVGVGG